MQPSDDKNKNNPNNPYRAIGVVSAIGTDLAACLIGGVYLGRWVDGYFGTAPAFLLIGLFVGLATGIYSMIQLVKRFL
ncbi:AtpZ/AtpI family protein [Effusibacillus dendaii]|nr:AtpZ/AtpI family protein [Effusibacillus dendaii]